MSAKTHCGSFSFANLSRLHVVEAHTSVFFTLEPDSLVLPAPHEDQCFTPSFLLLVAVGGLHCGVPNTSSWGHCWDLQCPRGWVILVSSVWLAISVQFANLASSPCQNEEKRSLSLGGHVGFDSLPDQLVSKSVTQGFSFNILCVGEHGPLQTAMGGGWDQDFWSVLLCHEPWQWLKQVRNAKLKKHIEWNQENFCNL